MLRIDSWKRNQWEHTQEGEQRRVKKTFKARQSLLITLIAELKVDAEA